MKYSKNSMYVYEKVPAHQSQVNGIILGPFASKKEAEELRKKYGYTSDNYYVGPFVDIEERDRKINEILNNYKVLSKDKIYTCEEESTLYPGVYFVRGNNNTVTSVSRDDYGIVFLEDLTDKKLEEILK